MAIGFCGNYDKYDNYDESVSFFSFEIEDSEEEIGSLLGVPT